MTPKSVLDAGKAEREKYVIGSPNDTDYTEVWRKEPPYEEPLHTGTRAECQDFIKDRVFRAMVRALADHCWEEFEYEAHYQLQKLAEDADG